MKNVTVRELQVNSTKLLRELPFTVTRYGKVIAIVRAPKQDEVFAHKTRKAGGTPLAELSLGTEEPLPEQGVYKPVVGDWETAQKQSGFCKTWHGKGVKNVVAKVIYEDPLGNEEEIYLCEKCAKSFEGRAKKDGGTIYYK